MAYLDDGTMVVVDNARKMISKTIDIVVTSVLQTTAGKMIFGRYIEPGMAAQAQSSGSGGRSSAFGDGAGSERAGVRGRNARGAADLIHDSVAAHSSVSLVADGLLSDPRDQRVHDRAGCGVDRVERVRPARPLRPPLRARVVLADSEDHRRSRARRGARADHTGHHLRVRVESPEHLRHSGALRRHCRTSSASSRRNRWRGSRCSGWHLRRGGHLFVDRTETGPLRHPRSLAGARRRTDCR